MTSTVGTTINLSLTPSTESITLISFAPVDHASPWTEVGLRTDPRLLRTYRADDTMNYEHTTLVGEGEDIANQCSTTCCPSRTWPRCTSGLSCRSASSTP